MLLESVLAPALVVPMESLLPIVVTTVVFVVIGLIVFAIAFVIIAKGDAVFRPQGDRRGSQRRARVRDCVRHTRQCADHRRRDPRMKNVFIFHLSFGISHLSFPDAPRI